jgi:hypothetical protein
VKIKTVVPKRAMHLSIVVALVSSLLSVSSSPANAISPCYVVEDNVLLDNVLVNGVLTDGVLTDGVLTDGSACSGNVVIDDSVTAIGQYNGGYGAFQLSGITSVTIPATVTSIAYGAFWDDSNRSLLTSVTFAPNSTLTSIDRWAFAGSRNLKSISLPSSLNSLSSVAFSGSGIRYLTFEGAPPVVVDYNSPDPGNLQDISGSPIAWVTTGNFAAFNSAYPKIVPDIRQLTGSTPPPTISSPTNGETLTATVGINFDGGVNFFGVGAPVVDVSAGPLPPGIVLNTTTGALSGAPTTVEQLVTRTYPVTFRVTDGADSATVTINFEVLPPTPPTITGETFTSYVGIPGDKSINLFTVGTRTVEKESGNLPPGVRINAANRIVGTPTETGTFNAILKVTDSYGQIDSAGFTFIVEAEPPVSISATQAVMYPTRSPDAPSYSEIIVTAPDGFVLCSFYKDAKVLGSLYQRDRCDEWQDSSLIDPGLSSEQDPFDYFENTAWVIRLYGPDTPQSGSGSPAIDTPFLATVTVNVSWESRYRNWKTPLPALTNGPKIGEPVYASAFERVLSRDLFKTGPKGNSDVYPTPEEYVYRITKRPNESATSVDHQSSSLPYYGLSITEQEDWYTSLGFGSNGTTIANASPETSSFLVDNALGILRGTVVTGNGIPQDTRVTNVVGRTIFIDKTILVPIIDETINFSTPAYEFTWSAFMCVAYTGPDLNLTATKPTGITYSYASREDGVPSGTLNTAHDLMFRNAVQDWLNGQSTSAQTTRSAVGKRYDDDYVRGFLGIPDEVGLYNYIWGLLDISANCGAGQTLTALRIVRENVNSPITTKDFTIPAILKLTDQGGDIVSVSPEGITIGVTGGGPSEEFNAALWGLTTIAGTVASPAPVVVYVPVPVPYLRTLTNPKLNLANGKLICTAGTYNAGYTLDGVIKGNSTALFSPTSFTYNLLINGVSQTKFTTTSALSATTWDLPAASSGSLFTCSISVTANTVTNTNGSNSDSSLVSAALKAQAQSVSLAEGNYNTAVNKNSMVYKQSLVDNRAKWRKEIETTRADYSATLLRIKAEGNSRKATSDRSAALKIMVAAQKKSAADYKTSGPADLEAKKSADQAALEAKTLAIAKANATYGTFIESIGYGVLIP